MPDLLVSVRNLQEAREVANRNVDILDVKEPSRGSLGAPDPETAVPIADFLHGRLPTSVAAGELPAAIRQRHLDWVDRFTFVKAGPAGISEIDEYARVWRQWLAQIPTGVQPVAVAYADWNAADCIRPTEILQAIASTRATGLLIDTCHKDYGLFEILSIEEIENLLQQANRRNIWVALAGSLCGDSVEKAIQVAPELWLCGGLSAEETVPIRLTEIWLTSWRLGFISS